MYILNSQQRLVRLKGSASTVYQSILGVLLPHIYPPGKLRDAIIRAKSTLEEHRDYCIDRIHSKLSHSNTSMIRNFLLAKPAGVYLKQDLLHWGLFFAGEIQACSNYRFEYMLAQKVMSHLQIKRDLNKACNMVYQFLKTEFPTFLKSVSSSFSPYNFFLIPYTSAQILRSPQKFNQSQCICALLAATDYIFKTVRGGYFYLPYNMKESDTNTLTEASKASITLPCTRTTHIFGFLSTLNEESQFILRQRQHNLTAEVPSYTTFRVLTLVQQARGELNELKAVAYALFAFWKLKYWNNLTNSDQYHSIMQMGAMFADLPYTPFSYNDILDDLGMSRQLQQQTFIKPHQNNKNQMYGELLAIIILLPYYFVNLAHQAMRNFGDNRKICFAIMFVAMGIIINEVMKPRHKIMDVDSPVLKDACLTP